MLMLRLKRQQGILVSPSTLLYHLSCILCNPAHYWLGFSWTAGLVEELSHVVHHSIKSKLYGKDKFVSDPVRQLQLYADFCGQAVFFLSAWKVLVHRTHVHGIAWTGLNGLINTCALISLLHGDCHRFQNLCCFCLLHLLRSLVLTCIYSLEHHPHNFSWLETQHGIFWIFTFSIHAAGVAYRTPTGERWAWHQG